MSLGLALPDENRELAGRFSGKGYLHVACDHADAVYVDFVTAYIPDELIWESPPLRRRERKRS